MPSPIARLVFFGFAVIVGSSLLGVFIRKAFDGFFTTDQLLVALAGITGAIVVIFGLLAQFQAP